MKKITYILIVITTMMFLGNMIFPKIFKENKVSADDDRRENTLNIMTTTKSQYYMVKSIIKDSHNVQFLLDNESDVQKFQVNKDVISRVSDMDLFIYTGFGYEPWISDVINSINKSNIGIIDMSRGVKAMPWKVNSVERNNPYYLLDFDSYKIALYNIKSAIQDKDTENRNEYEKNYNDAISQIKKYLDKKILEFDSFRDTKIITDTDVFDYFFKGLGLDVVKINKFEDIEENEDIKNIHNIIYVKDNEYSKVLGDDVTKEGSSILRLYRYNENESYIESVKHNIDIILGELKKIHQNS